MRKWFVGRARAQGRKRKRVPTPPHHTAPLPSAPYGRHRHRESEEEVEHEENDEDERDESQEEEGEGEEEDIFDELILLKENNQFLSYEERLLALLSSSSSSCSSSSSYQRDCALYELALLYCQLGHHDHKIDEFLSQLGYHFKLGKGIWNYDSTITASLQQTNGIAYCYDNVLPPHRNGLLTSLTSLFRSDSLFWSSHHYPTPQFFSYNVPLQRVRKDSKKKRKSGDGDGDDANLIQQLAQYLLPLVSKSFPELDLEKHVSSVEWWAHNRPNGSATGHRLHFDLDETRLRRLQQIGSRDRSNLHPLVSSVLYLDDGGTSAAPTLIIDESLSGSSRNAAWICPPLTNRLLIFKGDRLHGVIPHIHQSNLEDSTILIPPSSRITLMIGWWGKSVSTTPSPSQNAVATSFTPNMKLPPANTAPWRSLLSPISMTSSSPISLSPTPLVSVVGDVWEEVRSPGDQKHHDQISESEAVFVGNWFLKSRTEILDEIFPPDPEPQSTTLAGSSEAVEWISLADLKKLRGDA